MRGSTDNGNASEERNEMRAQWCVVYPLTHRVTDRPGLSPLSTVALRLSIHSLFFFGPVICLCVRPHKEKCQSNWTELEIV